MKTATIPHHQAAETAVATGTPQTISYFDRLTGQRISYCYFPDGTSMQYTTCRTIPRNTLFTAVDAIRSPGLVLKLKNDLCTVWYVWIDGVLHGQFHSETDALDFCIA